MAEISRYAASGFLNHLLRGTTFQKPSGLSVALTSTVPSGTDTGATITEIPSGINGSGTGYTRLPLGNPTVSGDGNWELVTDFWDAGSGKLENSINLLFSTALLDWGWVSGAVLLDSNEYGAGNVLLYAQLDNPRVAYTGDAMKFEMNTFDITLS